ncbi:hypothetical protein [Allocoleopsis sp.]|uniref:hypothetical protein n=1 Tax=Allocoleopsis sp. TaxID=3088169 RepID=UPI002FD4E116
MIVAQNSITQVRAITLWQPWASLVALGLKLYETRSWLTNYRGKLLIHAASESTHKITHDEINLAWDACRMAGKDSFSREVLDFAYPPYSCIIAIADLTQCSEMTWLPAVNPPWDQISLNRTCSELSDLEITVGDWQPGRYAWRLENVKALAEPIPYKGKQGLWVPDADLIEKLGGAV